MLGSTFIVFCYGWSLLHSKQFLFEEGGWTK